MATLGRREDDARGRREGEDRIALEIHFIDTVPTSDSTLGSASSLIQLK